MAKNGLEVAVLREEIYVNYKNPESYISEAYPMFYTTAENMEPDLQLLCDYHNACLAINLLQSIDLSKFKFAEYARAIELVDRIESSLKGIIQNNSENKPQVILDKADEIKAINFSKLLPRSLKRAANRINALAIIAAEDGDEDTHKKIEKNKPSIFERIFKSFIQFVDKYSKKGPKNKDIYTEDFNISKDYDIVAQKSSDEASLSTEDKLSKSTRSTSSNTESPAPSITDQKKPEDSASIHQEQPHKNDKTLVELPPEKPQTQSETVKTQFNLASLFQHPGIFSLIFKRLPPKSLGIFAITSMGAKKAVDTYYEKYLLSAPFNLPTDTKEKNQVLEGLLSKALNSKNPQLLNFVLSNMSEDKKNTKLKSLLKEAIEHNNIDIVRLLLNGHPQTKQPYIDINSTIKEQERNSFIPALTPLKLAASLGFDEIMRLCVDNGALIQSSGRTELFWANYGKNEECVKIILKMVDDKKAQNPDKLNNDAPLNQYGYGILFAQRALPEAIESGNVEILKILLQHGCNPINNQHESNPILHAAYLTHTDMIPVLQKNGATLDIKLPENFRTLITLSHITQIAEIIQNQPILNDDDKVILSNIVLINNLLNTDKESDSTIADQYFPLHVLAQYGSQLTESFIKTIIDNSIARGLDINKQDDSKNTALHLAVIADNIELVKTLLEAGAQKDILNGRNQTPAELSKNPQIIELFTTGPQPA